MLLPLAAALAVALATDPTPSVNPRPEKPDAAAAAAGKKADEKKIVCREETKPNSRFRAQVCLTKKEWEERGRSGEEVARELGNRPNVNLVPGS